MRSLILGGDSSISSHLDVFLNTKGIEVVKTSRRPGKNDHLFLDLEDPNAFKIPREIEDAYFLAGINGVAVNNDLSLSHRVNVLGARSVISRLLNQNIRVIYFSSSSVFRSSDDFNSEDSKVNPITAYGKQKHLVERAFLAEENFSVVRPSKLVYPGSPLINRWRDLTLAGKQLVMNPLAKVAPIGMNFFLNSIFSISQSKVNGVWHLSGSELMTFLQLSKLIENFLNLNESFSYKVETNQREVALSSAIMSMVRTTELLGIVPQTVNDFLEDFKTYLESDQKPLNG